MRAQAFGTKLHDLWTNALVFVRAASCDGSTHLANAGNVPQNLSDELA